MIAASVYHQEESPLDPDDPKATVEFLVEEFAGVPPGDPRNDDLEAALADYLDDAAAVTNNQRELWQSAFTLVCMSPYVTSTDL